MSIFYKKYRDYKREYINLKEKIGGNNNSANNYENREVDWYLFFDLWQVVNDIINLTNEQDIVILIGDTSSYLSPILELYREVYLLPFSNKPFGCLWPPYGIPSEEGPFKYTDTVWTPSKNNLESYFTYLDTKTKLTRKFVLENWRNIILVDSSIGQSIHGVSIIGT